MAKAIAATAAADAVADADAASRRDDDSRTLPPSAARRATRGTRLLLAGVLVLVTLALYWRANAFGFILYDDPNYLELNADVRQGLSLESVRWAFTGVHHANWHPLTTLSYLVEHQLFGLNPRPYHVTNIVLHAVNGGLLLLVLGALTGSTWRSAFVAAVFALHPLRVESVAWVSERKDVLSALFWILAIAAYARYARRPTARAYALVALMLALGLMSKPMVVTLPAVLLLLDVWPLKRVRVGVGAGAAGATASANLRRRDQKAYASPPSSPPSPPGTITLARAVAEKLPLLVLSLASAVVTFLVQRASGAVATIELVAWDVRLANAVLAYAWYVGKTLWPRGLTIFYPLTGDLGAWPLALAFLLAVTALAAWQFRRRPYLLVGWLWFLGTLVPVIGLVQVGDQATADRYSYIPSIGLTLMIAWAAGELLAALPRARLVTSLGAAAILLACAATTWRLLGFWKDTPTLFTRATTVVPRNAKAHTVLGTAHQLGGRIELALKEYQTAADIRGDYPEAYARIGVCYAALNDYERSAAAFTTAVGQLEQSGYASDVLRRNAVYNDSIYNLAWAQMELGRLAEAEHGFRRALELQHRVADAHAALASVYNRQARAADAMSEAEAALRLAPAHDTARFQRGIANMQLGNAEGAARDFADEAKRDPRNASAQFQLGAAMARLGRSDEAIAAFRQVLEINPADGDAHLKLGVLLQGKGEVDAAIGHYRTAMQRAVAAAGNNIAWVRATHREARFRNGAEAVALCEELLKTAGRRPDLLDTLAAAYAETGDFPRAIATARDAADGAAKAGDAQLAQQIRERAALYEKGTAFRE